MLILGNFSSFSSFFGCLIVLVLVEGLRPPFVEVEVPLHQSFHLS